MTKQHLTGTASQLIEWYWTHGARRDLRYQLSPSGWLFRLYQVQERLNALPEGGREKPAFGLWGPSQVGKSTLLSTYLDLGADEMGQNSPLQWHSDDPVRFEREGLRTDVVALNPYNLKSDASACITRFVLASSVDEERYPVEVCLSTGGQLLHSMALGYLSEWTQSEQRPLTDESLGDLLNALKHPPQQPAARTFETMYETASLLDVLTRSRLQDNRYSGLTTRSVARLLENRLALGDARNAEELQRRIFWGNAASLNALHSGLVQMLQRIRSLAGAESCRIYCSYQVAAVLLDMASYVRAVGGIDMQGNHVQADLGQERRLLGIKYQYARNRLLLSFDTGNALFDNVEQFAFFQALVWELVVPVNATRLADRGPDGQTLERLLIAADILDFPGVSNVGSGGDDRLSEAIISTNGRHLLFSHFLKRGKTSAMVAATARAKSIDGFCLLFRTMAPIARPGLICEGIRTWWRFHTGEDLGGQNAEAPPVNIVLTFFTEFLNDVLRNPQITRFSLAFEKLRSLGSISTPDISQYFAVAFRKYERLSPPPGAGQTPDERRAHLEDAYTRIMNDPETGALFRDPAVIRRVTKGTAISTLLESLTSQAGALAGRNRLRNQLVRQQQELRQLIDEAAPGDGLEQSRRKELLGKWATEVQTRTGLRGRFNRQESETLSCGIRTLLTVLPDDLESLPVNLVESGRDPKPYLVAQCTRWREKDRSDHDPAQAAITDSSDIARILAYFCDSISLEDVGQWLRTNFGWIGDRSTARDGRRYLAAYLTDRILFGKDDAARPHRTLEGNSSQDCYSVLQKLAEAEVQTTSAAPDSCPHYRSILEPFLTRITTLAETIGSGRPTLPGDAELSAIQTAFHSALSATR